MPEETNAPRRVRKCDALTVLGAQLIDMLTANPNAPEFRAMVLRKCLKPLPDECTTFKKIIDWVEFNIEPRAIPADSPFPVNPNRPDMHLEGEHLVLILNTTEEQRGTCCYSCTSYGRSRVRLGPESIADAAEEADNLDSFKEQLRELINDHVWDNNQENDTDNYEYDDYNNTGSDNGDWVFREREGIDTVADMALQVLRRTNPELYEKLNPE